MKKILRRALDGKGFLPPVVLFFVLFIPVALLSFITEQFTEKWITYFFFSPLYTLCLFAFLLHFVEQD